MPTTKELEVYTYLKELGYVPKRSEVAAKFNFSTIRFDMIMNHLKRDGYIIKTQTYQFVK